MRMTCDNERTDISVLAGGERVLITTTAGQTKNKKVVAVATVDVTTTEKDLTIRVRTDAGSVFIKVTDITRSMDVTQAKGTCYTHEVM